MFAVNAPPRPPPTGGGEVRPLVGTESADDSKHLCPWRIAICLTGFDIDEGSVKSSTLTHAIYCVYDAIALILGCCFTDLQILQCVVNVIDHQ